MKLFNFKKDDIGVEYPEDTTPNVGFFFKSLGRKFTKLIPINLLAIFQFAPLIIAFFTYFWTEMKPTIIDSAYPILQGIIDFPEATPADLIAMCASSIQYRIPHETWGLLILLFGLYLVFVLTFGFWNVGLTYLMRELVNGRPVFIISDMKYAIKRNFKQALGFGILDALLITILVVDFSYLSSLPSDFFGDFMYIAVIAISVIYFIMRFYLYLMLITFDMKLGKLFKNALIFVALGIKRNALAILWMIAMIAINVCIFVIYQPLGIIMPILYIISFPMFTTAYAAYPIIKKYMIDPVPQNNNAVEESEE